MKRFFKPCGDYRESLCLLASGVLPRQELAHLEAHLAACDECRAHCAELRSVARPLANWEETFAKVEPSQAAQASWAKDFSAALAPARSVWPEALSSVLDWCKDMVWPCRRIWTGLAVVWLALLMVNVSQRGPSRTEAKRGSRPSPEMVRAYLEHEGFLVEMSRPARKREVEPPKPLMPEPRSEWRHTRFPV